MDELFSDLVKIEKGAPVTASAKPKKTPPTHREITVSFKMRKLLVPAIVIAGIVILGIAILKFFPKKESTLFLSNKPSLAVLYFENRSGDENLDKFRIGLPELLVSGLSKSKYLKILRMDEITGVLQDLNLVDVNNYSSENLEAVAKEGDIDYLVWGSCIEMGDSFTISVRLINSDTRETSLAISSTAEKEKKLPVKIKYLAMKIRKQIDSPFEVVMEQAIEDFGSTLIIGKK